MESLNSAEPNNRENFEKSDIYEREDVTGNDHSKEPAEYASRAADVEPATSSVQVDEKKILRKMDLRLVPMLSCLYLLAFLDRGNIGNAKIEGLQEDLNMTSDQYNWCLTVFFFSYSAFEVPSNLILKKLRPSLWLPSIMVAWGVVMTLMGIVNNYAGLLAARFFLGVTEAGLFPGVAYYLTMWYCRHEIQFRTALFFCAGSAAGAFSGLLAFAIAKMDGIGGLEGWRWIFILEGILTVLVAIISFWALYDYPETANFLTLEEKEFVTNRLQYQGQRDARNDTSSHVSAEGAAVFVPQEEEFKWSYVAQAFKDWQIYIHILVFWGCVCPLYGISLFLPTIVKNLGYTSSTAQLLTVPIYITAAITGVLVAWISDKSGKRSPFILAFMLLMAVAFIMCIASHDPKVAYAALFLAACGVYSAFPGTIVWASNNLAGSCKRSSGMALHIGVGNLGGAFAANFYRQQDGPRYILGHALELGFLAMAMIAISILVASYAKINKSRRSKLESGQPLPPIKELSSQGDRAVTFRYMY